MSIMNGFPSGALLSNNLTTSTSGTALDAYQGYLLQTNKAAKSSSVSVTLAAASWSGTTTPYTYAATVSGVTATSNQEMLPATSITQTQLNTLQAANIIGYSQTTNSVTLRAWGTKPTVDIPVVFIVRGDA